MDEESRREKILPGTSGVFPQRKAGSKGYRETSAKARPFQRRTTASESEGIALLAGRRAYTKTGGGHAPFTLIKIPRGNILILDIQRR